MKTTNSRYRKIAKKVAKRCLESSSFLPGDGDDSTYPTKLPVSGFSTFIKEKGDGGGDPSPFETLEEDFPDIVEDPNDHIHEIDVQPSFQFNVPTIKEDIRR